MKLNITIVILASFMSAGQFSGVISGTISLKKSAAVLLRRHFK